MRTDHYSPGPPPPDEAGRRVVDDLPEDMPVTDAELDVIEAFLGAQIRAILSDQPDVRSGASNAGLTTCHNHAKLSHPAAKTVSRR
ncbi:hypothetical protein [Afifella pfennigii]|uniref:hypothetical protein n=1 Tax=Afifella pfennigii TaxID=209897 RepID=UPI0012ECA658|nr:hypothetical protein [Afifella pfennigii]